MGRAGRARPPRLSPRGSGRWTLPPEYPPLCPVAAADRRDGVGPAAEDGGPGEREGRCASGHAGLRTVSAARGPDAGPLAFQELFSKQKGYLDEELDFRKQSLDQAHKVREARPPERPGVADSG